MSVTLSEYRKGTESTAIYPPEKALEYLALGLVGEAGEVANKVKKVIRDSGGEITPETRAAIGAELGDVAWYMDRLAALLGLELGEILSENLDKLKDRAARGVIGGNGDRR